MTPATLDQPTAAEPLSAYELERGKPTPSRNHTIAQQNLGLEFAKDRRFFPHPELTLRLPDGDLTPDISIFPRVPVDWDHDESQVAEPPLLVVEILSPHQGMEPVMDKLDRYFAHGVQSCWIVTPFLKTISIITADRARRTFDRGEAIDPAIGITANVDAVFA